MQLLDTCKTAGRGGLVLMVVGQIIAMVSTPVVAQRVPDRVPPSCGGQENVVVRLGFSFSCNCSVRERDGSRTWSFFAEPVVTGVERDVPASDDLRTGDAIIAVNGHLVTTTSGGAEFAALERGAPATLRVLRGERLLTTEVQPAAACRAQEVSARLPSGEDSSRLPTMIDQPARISDAYMGFGIRARASAQRPADGPVEWRFFEPPAVDQVTANSPADHAGLRSGDTLTHVDGVSITTGEGGRRFGAIRAGQSVQLGFRRSGTVQTTILHPTTRPAGRVLGVLRGVQGLSQEDESFSGSIDDVVVKVTGPAAIERLSDRILVRTHDGAVTVVIRADRGARN